jgi:hypothetical protein
MDILINLQQVHIHFLILKSSVCFTVEVGEEIISYMIGLDSPHILHLSPFVLTNVHLKQRHFARGKMIGEATGTTGKATGKATGELTTDAC